MTRTVALSLVLAASIFAAEPADGVREAGAGWRKAVIDKDESALKRFCAGDLTYTHSNGRTQDKAGLLGVY